jgi:signal transduction histidine kinase
VIIKSIDQAMSESLTAYFLVHEGLREQFSITLTHDLRTPLTAITASAGYILRYPDRAEQFPIQAARIMDNVKRIDRMIQDLLDASRVRFGERILFDVEECELLTLVREVTNQLSTVHGDRFVLKGEPIHGYWNADAFRRAIENLLVNAVKYGDPGTPVTIRVDEVHGRAVLSVHNEGPVIPAEEQEVLFRSFMRSRTVAASRKRGWGLGLAMVRGMAEGHGGSISVDSGPERGTKFIIDVPVDSRPHLGHPVTPGT